jgi:hypothetical protein
MNNLYYSMTLPREILILGFKKIENYFYMWLCMYESLTFVLESFIFRLYLFFQNDI